MKFDGRLKIVMYSLKWLLISIKVVELSMNC